MGKSKSKVKGDPGYTCSTFSLANPAGKRQGNVPRLLRRLASRIEELGPDTMILDVTFEEEVTSEGPWVSATVYYALNGWKR